MRYIPYILKYIAAVFAVVFSIYITIPVSSGMVIFIFSKERMKSNVRMQSAGHSQPEGRNG